MSLIKLIKLARSVRLLSIHGGSYLGCSIGLFCSTVSDFSFSSILGEPLSFLFKESFPTSSTSSLRSSRPQRDDVGLGGGACWVFILLGLWVGLRVRGYHKTGKNIDRPSRPSSIGSSINSVPPAIVCVASTI